MFFEIFMEFVILRFHKIEIIQAQQYNCEISQNIPSDCVLSRVYVPKPFNLLLTIPFN